MVVMLDTKEEFRRNPLIDGLGSSKSRPPAKLPQGQGGWLFDRANGVRGTTCGPSFIERGMVKRRDRSCDVLPTW